MEFFEYMFSLPSLGAATLVTILNIVRIIAVHNKNNKEISANNYVNENNYEIISKDSKFIRSYETKTKINNKN